MHRLLLAVALMFAACASGAANLPATTTIGTPNAAASNDVEDSDVICRMEVRTGTHMERNICRSQAERDEDRRFVQNLMLGAKRQSQ